MAKKNRFNKKKRKRYIKNLSKTYMNTCLALAENKDFKDFEVFLYLFRLSSKLLTGRIDKNRPYFCLHRYKNIIKYLKN